MNRIPAPIVLLVAALGLSACTATSYRQGASESSVAPAATGSREFYVAPNGADANPGTRERPFQTLARARDAVRVVSPHMTGDIVVYVRGGTYPVTSPIEFGTADSGRNGFNVVYRAYASEVPIISGGVPVTGWRLDHGNVWRAQLNRGEKLRGLFVNGQRAELTHGEFHGKGPWGEFVIQGNEPWAETPGKTLDGIQFDAADVPVFANPGEVELVQARVWNFLVVGVRGMTSEGGKTVVQLQQPYGAIAATMAWKCNLDPEGKFTLRNAYELLRNPGEFFFNPASRTLYYIPRPGEDLAKADVIAPTSEGLLSIVGENSANRVHHLVFRGLTFSHDHWSLKKVGESRGVAGVQSSALYTRFRADGDWHPTHYNICDLPQATVAVRSARYVTFERNRFVHLSSGNALSLVNDVVDSAVIGNVFHDDSGNAVNVGHPQHYIIGDGPLFPSGIEGACTNITVSNNWVRNVSLDFKQEEAINGFTTQGVSILHNDIEGVPYGGIALGWGWGNSQLVPSDVPRNNTIAYNRVVATQQQLPFDGGAIYVLGVQYGGRIEYNYVDSVGANLYPDDGSAYWSISNNVLHPRRGPGDHHLNDSWLHVWTPRCHDLRIDHNYTSGSNQTNRGTNTVPTNTHLEQPYPAAAQEIIERAGLEPAYRDIVEKQVVPARAEGPIGPKPSALAHPATHRTL